MFTQNLLFAIVIFPLGSCEYRWKGPGPHSQGAVWPLPQKQSCEKTSLRLASRVKFEFRVESNVKCDIIDSMVERYKEILFGRGSTDLTESVSLKSVSSLQIVFNGSCPDWPQFGMLESYVLVVKSDSNGGAMLSSNSVWGLLRGIESFTHLVFYPNVTNVNQRDIKQCTISDWPRFAHRGLLIDTSRHFISVKKLVETLELMSYNKYNVLHWHIVDDQSFPFASHTFPNVTFMGAYSRRHVYSRADVETILKEARLRGIRVMVEFDSPGHTRSWGKGHNGLLCECFDDEGEQYDTALPDVTKTDTWDFILALFTEVLAVFPDNYVHLGGDEVTYDFPCWLNNKRIQRFMKQWNFTSANQVERFYMKQLFSLVERARPGIQRIMWQEVVDQNVTTPSDTIAHVWKGKTVDEIATEMQMVTARGYKAILSSCWYLNYISYGNDWIKYYECDPHKFNGTVDEKRLVLGGEAAMWGEYVDGTNITPRLWPRASAVAERLWSDDAQIVNITDHTFARMEEHRCRMLMRGYPVQPDNGPNMCLHIYDDK